MGAEKAIYEFLVQQDNLAGAMEMSQYVERLQLDMHNRFWAAFNSYMDQRIKGSEYALTWKFIPYNTRRIRQDWEKTYIQPLGERENKPSHLQFVFAQASRAGGFPLYWGVKWSTPPPEENTPGMVSLRVLLTEKNITIAEPPVWIYWGWYQYRLYEAGTLVNLYTKTDEFVKEIVDDVWNLFTDLRPLLEKVNLEVNPNP